MDEYTLLCEKCGYVIEGLDHAGLCPECGKPIAESLPERRVGTPWQQAPNAGSLVRTWWMTLRHPLRTLDVMKIDERRGKSLAIWTCTPTLIGWPILMMLTSIEASGLIVIGKQRSARVTQAVAWSVVGHGAVGWLVSLIGIVVGIILLSIWINTALEYYEYATQGRPQDFSSRNADILFFIALTTGGL